MPLHVDAFIEYPDMGTQPTFGRLVSEEGAHELIELGWPRARTGSMPGYGRIHVEDPIVVRLAKRAVSTAHRSRYFYGYVSAFSPSAKGMTLTALATTRDLRNSNPRFFESMLLSSLLTTVVEPYNMKCVLDGPNAYVQGLYQGDSDWAFLNELAMNYGYALVSYHDAVVLRSRYNTSFSTPQLAISQKQRGPTGITTGRWMLPPARTVAGDQLAVYHTANVDPRTGAPFVVAQAATYALRTRQVVMASNGYEDAHTSLTGTADAANHSLDQAMGVLNDGEPFLKAGQTIYSYTDKEDLDGMWWIRRAETNFATAEHGSTTLELSRPADGWRADQVSMAVLRRAPTAREPTNRPRLLGSRWQW